MADSKHLRAMVPAIGWNSMTRTEPQTASQHSDCKAILDPEHDSSISSTRQFFRIKIKTRKETRPFPRFYAYSILGANNDLVRIVQFPPLWQPLQLVIER